MRRITFFLAGLSIAVIVVGCEMQQPEKEKPEAPALLPLGAIAQLGKPDPNNPVYNNTMAFSPDGKTLATHHSYFVRVWDLKTYKMIKEIDIRSFGSSNVLAISNDGKFLVTGHDGAAVVAWNIETGKVHHILREADKRLLDPVQAGKIPPGQALTGLSMSVLSDGRTLVVNHLQGLKFWDLPSGKELKNKNHPGNQGSIFSIFISPDGRWVGSHAWGTIPLRTIIPLWDAKTGKIIQILEAQYPKRIISSTSPETATFSQDNRFIVDVVTYMEWVEAAPGTKLGHDVQRKKIRVWEIATGQPILELQAPKDFYRVYFARNSQFLLSNKKGRLNQHHLDMWDLRQGKFLQTIELPGPAGVTISPDGKILVGADVADGSIILWDLAKILPAEEKALVPQFQELEKCLQQLGEADPKIGRKSLWQLVAGGDQSVAILKKELNPVPKISRPQMDQWVADLDSDSFAKREKGLTELQSQANLAIPALEKGLAGKISLEHHQRINMVLKKIQPPYPTGKFLQTLRALEVLERIGTPSAKELLRALAEQGAPGHKLTEEAQGILSRLD